MEYTTWNKTENRFVAFFDILGFKEMVARNSHAHILEKLESLKNIILSYDEFSEQDALKEYNLEKDQCKSVTFSDSIIFFSKGESFKDLLRIILDSSWTVKHATKLGIAIKGGLSFGEITVDFENSLFFGQPIIDAYLLHEELQMITAVLDNNIESKLSEFDSVPILQDMLIDYKAYMKSGKIRHKILKPRAQYVKRRIETFKKLYMFTAGRPRLYIDNTLDFLNSL